MKIRKWLWGFVLLPMVGMALFAQEPGTDESAAQPADQAPAPATDDQPPPSSAQESDPPEEQVSADNNLSFPVDI